MVQKNKRKFWFNAKPKTKGTMTNKKEVKVLTKRLNDKMVVIGIS